MARQSEKTAPPKIRLRATLGRQRLEERAPRGDLLTEEEVEAEAGEGDRNGEDEHGEQWRVCAVTAGGLAVAAGPVAGKRVEERRDAERVEGDDVHEQPAEEARDRSGDGTAEQGDREEREQEHVGGPARDVEGCDERHLQERGDEDDHGEGDVVVHYGSSGSGRRETRTSTESSAEKSTSETTSTCQ